MKISRSITLITILASLVIMTEVNALAKNELTIKGTVDKSFTKGTLTVFNGIVKDKDGFEMRVYHIRLSIMLKRIHYHSEVI